MKTPHVIGLSMLAGIALGAIAIQGLHAQAKPPAIVVVDINDITDPEGFKAVTQRPTASTATVMEGGRYIARSANVTALQGTAPKRSIIIAFDNAEKAPAWYTSPEQKKINEIRTKTTQSRVFMVEGM
ncbi:MAG: DUF1330 domain-containing protein [Pseudolabrys sp.]